MSSPRDPKGYYACLDVPHNANAQTIKAAYRRLAKQRHPDRNPSANAQEEFQQLSEAYQVLSDPHRRRVYDVRAQQGPEQAGNRGAANGATSQTNTAGAHAEAKTAANSAGAQSKAGAQAGAKAGAKGKANGKTDSDRAQDAYRQANARQGRATAHAGRAQSPKGPFEPPEPCQCCGKLAAQPRYVVFPTVRGLGFKSRRSTVEGVFCRACADTTALRAAWKNWLLGWWSLPFGPLHTLAAITTIARGGYMPRDRNFHLLLKQARAFLMRDQQALAHGLAVQANAYANSPQEKSLAEGLLRAAPSVRNLKLRNKWLGLSWARAGQIVPPVLAISLLAAGIDQLSSLNFTSSPKGQPIAQGPSVEPPEALRGLLDEGLDRPMLLRTGRIYEVTTALLPLRTGPGTGYRKQAELEIGTSVLVTENAPEGGWVRVLTAEGLSGFVAGRYLTPGLPGRALDDSLSNGAGKGSTPPSGGESPDQPLTPPLGGHRFTVPSAPGANNGGPQGSAAPRAGTGAASMYDASSPADSRRPPPLKPGVGLFSTPPTQDR
jgi:hypothetical protein